jgi:branched-chain amino acid transport system ATP-binding protein
MLLRLREVTTYYGQVRILEGVSLEVGAGELVCLLGGNASGKSTTLKTVLGVVRPRAGSVELDGEDVSRRSVSARISRGMAIVPENRRLFAPLTVAENLELGAYLRKGDLSDDLERVHGLFPRLYERRAQVAGTLSGGEQQMLAMGRALMSRPRLLLMDEPSMGLSPALVEQNFEIHPAGPRERRGCPRGRAERQHGALDRRPRLRPADGGDRPLRHGLLAAGQRGPQAGLPRNSPRAMISRWISEAPS